MHPLNLSGIYTYSLSICKEKIFPFITQHKKITLIASLALGCLAALYLRNHCGFLKEKTRKKDEQFQRSEENGITTIIRPDGKIVKGTFDKNGMLLEGKMIQINSNGTEKVLQEYSNGRLQPPKEEKKES